MYDSPYQPTARDRVKDASVLDVVAVSLDASSGCKEINLLTHIPNFGIQGQYYKCNTVAGARHYHSRHDQQWRACVARIAMDTLKEVGSW